VSVTATFLEGWDLVENDVQLRSVKRRETDVAAGVMRGWLEQADTSSIQIKRHFVGLLTFADDAGSEQAGFSYHVGNGVTLSFSRIGGLKYLCTRNTIKIDDLIIGEGWEMQTWERVSKFEMVEGSYYEEPIPEEGTAYDPITPPAPPEE